MQVSDIVYALQGKSVFSHIISVMQFFIVFCPFFLLFVCCNNLTFAIS